MKRELIAAFMLVLSSTSVAQGGFTTTTPANGPASVWASGDVVSASGHWVPLDKQSELSGPEVSNIACLKSSNTCTETEANMRVRDDGFKLDASYSEYQVERWNTKELVASTVHDGCGGLRLVLKIDLAGKRVYFSQSLSRPATVSEMPEVERGICMKENKFYELKEPAVWNNQWKKP